MSDTPAPASSKKSAQAKAEPTAFPSIRMVKPIEGSDVPVAVFVREDQVNAFTKDGFKREDA
jgi:hypothetical protein